MSTQDNVQVIQRGYEAFGRGDIDALLDLFADDIEWITSGPAELATAGRRQGKQQVAEYFKSVNELFELHSFNPVTFVAEGDKVIVFGTNEATFRATGVRLPVLDWAHSFILRDGKVTHFQEIFDTAPIVAQLEAVRQRA